MMSSLVFVVLVILVTISGVCPSHIDCEPCVCSVSADGSITADCNKRQLNKSYIPLPQKIRGNVTTLLLSSNEFNSVPLLRGFVNLRHLDISRNLLKKLDIDSFVDVEKLTHLILHGNSLLLSKISYPPGLFRSQTSLVSLDIKENDNLKNLSSSYPDETLGDLVALETLSMDGLPNEMFGPGFKNLTNLAHLSLSGKEGNCRIGSISNNTFINLVSVRYLDLSGCGILNVHSNAFEPLRNIECLNVSINRGLGLDSLGAVIHGLSNSPLKTLEAKEIVPSFAVGVQLKYKHVKPLCNVTLKMLFLDSNRIELIEDTALTCLTHLESVSLDKNKLTFGTYLFSSDPMINLKQVTAANQYESAKLPGFLSTARRPYLSGSKLLPRMYKRSLYERTIHRLFSSNVSIKVPLPPNISYINVSNSVLEYEIPRIEFYENKLLVIDASSNSLTKWFGPIGPLDYLQYLDLSNNHCNHISADFLKYTFNLRTLNLSHNSLASSLLHNGDIFKNLTHLEILKLDRNIMEMLPKDIFRDLENLRYLDLRSNWMTTWGIRIKHMTHLNHLDISYNRFQSIPEDLRQQIDEIVQRQGRNKDKFRINIKRNELKCDCTTLDSLQWMLNDHITVTHLNGTLCEVENIGHLKEIVENLKFKCYVVVPVILTTSAGIFLSIVISIGGIAYRHRWRLRYLYYSTRRRYKGYQRLTEDHSYTYDAFVSYADEDRCFVTEDMRHILEDRYGLKLCIHHRNFMVGEAITANILNAIQSSRKTVVVLSPNFIRSSWCDYEVHMAKMEQIHGGRDVLCIVWYENIPNKNDISEDLDEELCSGTYLDFRNVGPDNEQLWKRLRQAIEGYGQED